LNHLDLLQKENFGLVFGWFEEDLGFDSESRWAGARARGIQTSPTRSCAVYGSLKFEKEKPGFAQLNNENAW
jgi:hypothetical protein